MFGWKRKKSLIINLIGISVLSLPAVLGFNMLSGITPMGAGTNIMDLEDFLVSGNILPLGSLLFVLFCTRKNGWGFENFVAEADNGIGKPFPQYLNIIMHINAGSNRDVRVSKDFLNGINIYIIFPQQRSECVP